MRAAVLPSVGEPLRIEEIPIPRPRAGEVLVEVAACGVCHTDLHVMKGEVPFPKPAVLGHEISGRIVELGPNVVMPPIGTRVIGTFIMPCGACEACQRGRDDLCDPFFSKNRALGVLHGVRSRRSDLDPRCLATSPLRAARPHRAIGLRRG